MTLPEAGSALTDKTLAVVWRDKNAFARRWHLKCTTGNSETRKLEQSLLTPASQGVICYKIAGNEINLDMNPT